MLFKHVLNTAAQVSLSHIILISRGDLRTLIRSRSSLLAYIREWLNFLWLEYVPRSGYNAFHCEETYLCMMMKYGLIFIYYCDLGLVRFIISLFNHSSFMELVL